MKILRRTGRNTGTVNKGTNTMSYATSMNTRLVSAALFIALSAVAGRADSLYPQSSTTSGMVSLFSDTKAHNVGDILTIDVIESASGNSTAGTSASKNDSFTFGPGTGSILSLIRSFGLSGSTSTTATGATNRSSGLTQTISVVVKQVFPNGTLLVEGKKDVAVNSETEETTFTGLVREVDITTNNTIDSGEVADAQIHYSGKGPVGDKQGEGIVSKISKWLF